MYYREKMIDGIMCAQHTPNGKWVKLSQKELSDRLSKARLQIGILMDLIELRKEIQSMKECGLER